MSKKFTSYQKLNFKQLLVSVSNKSKKQSLNQNYWLGALLFSPLAKNSIKKQKTIFLYIILKNVFTQN